MIRTDASVVLLIALTLAACTRTEPQHSAAAAKSAASVTLTSSAALAAPDPLAGWADALRKSVEQAAAGWPHRVVRKDALGSDERWCSPEEPACDSPAYELKSDQERLELTFTRKNAATEWSVAGYVQPSTGGFAFDFTRGAEHVQLSLQESYNYKDMIDVATPPEPEIVDRLLFLDTALRPLFSSADHLRDRTVRREQALRALILADRHEYRVTSESCAHSPTRLQEVTYDASTALIDTCPRRSLTPQEESAFVAAATAEIDGRTARVRRDAPALHRALTLALPLDQHWPTR